MSDHAKTRNQPRRTLQLWQQKAKFERAQFARHKQTTSKPSCSFTLLAAVSAAALISSTADRKLSARAWWLKAVLQRAEDTSSIWKQCSVSLLPLLAEVRLLAERHVVNMKLQGWLLSATLQFYKEEDRERDSYHTNSGHAESFKVYFPSHCCRLGGKHCACLQMHQEKDKKARLNLSASTIKDKYQHEQSVLQIRSKIQINSCKIIQKSDTETRMRSTKNTHPLCLTRLNRSK